MCQLTPVSQETFCISYEYLLQTGKCAREKWILGCRAEGKRSPQNHRIFSVTNKQMNPNFLWPRNSLSSGMVIPLLVFYSSHQNPFSDRTALTQDSKKCALWKKAFFHIHHLNESSSFSYFLN